MRYEPRHRFHRAQIYGTMYGYHCVFIMIDKEKIAVRVKENLFLTDENKKKLLEVLDKATEEHLIELTKLLDQETVIVNAIIGKVMETGLASENPEAFMTEMKKSMSDAHLKVLHEEEESEKAEEEKREEELLKQME